MLKFERPLQRSQLLRRPLLVPSTCQAGAPFTCRAEGEASSVSIRYWPVRCGVARSTCRHSNRALSVLHPLHTRPPTRHSRTTAPEHRCHHCVLGSPLRVSVAAAVYRCHARGDVLCLRRLPGVVLRWWRMCVNCIRWPRYAARAHARRVAAAALTPFAAHHIRAVVCVAEAPVPRGGAACR